MDQEKLIESVKSWEALYVITHSRYNDAAFKENAWREIAKEIEQSAATCKKTWTNLRDSYRRALKKKRGRASMQGPWKLKKWKFEDKMSFLLPYMHERSASTNLTELSDDDNEDEQNTDECDDNNDDRDDDNKVDVGIIESNAENEKTKGETEINGDFVTKGRKYKAQKPQAQSETASGGIMKYLLEKKTADPIIIPPANQRPSATESFFSSMATTVENFSPYYENIAKAKIFAIVTDLEMQQIMQQEQFLTPDAPTQRPSSAPIKMIPP